MKRNFIIALVAFAAVTTAVGSAVASLLPESLVATTVWIRRNPASSSQTPPNKINAGSYNLLTGSNTVIISVTDNVFGQNTRIGYESTLTTPLTSSQAGAYSSSIVIN